MAAHNARTWQHRGRTHQTKLVSTGPQIREVNVTEERWETGELSQDTAVLQMDTLSLSLSDEALAELAEVLAMPPGPIGPDTIVAALHEAVTSPVGGSS